VPASQEDIEVLQRIRLSSTYVRLALVAAVLIPVLLSEYTPLKALAVAAYEKHLAGNDDLTNQETNSLVRRMQDLLQSGFGIKMDIAGADEIYQNVYEKREGNSNSPASMLTDPNLCRLILSDTKLSEWVGRSKYPEDFKLFSALHEVSHCLFIMPDYAVSASNSDELTGFLHSLPIEDRLAIKTFSQLLAAENKPEVSLYREALGDVFALGYFRLMSLDPDNAKAKNFKLIRDRETDGIHYTGCWITAATNFRVSPNNIGDLKVWALTIVETAQCDLAAENKKSRDRALKHRARGKSFAQRRH